MANGNDSTVTVFVKRTDGVLEVVTGARKTSFEEEMNKLIEDADKGNVTGRSNP